MGHFGIVVAHLLAMLGNNLATPRYLIKSVPFGIQAAVLADMD